eukprot:767193-Hanusia_phi.AAC.1
MADNIVALQALLYNPKSADAMYNLGVAYIEKNEPEKAIICYELTTQMNPRCAEAYNNLGVIYKDFDNLPRALQCYESAIRVKPAFPEALNNMGVVFTMMCQPEDAFAYFNAALQVYPNYSEAYTNLGHQPSLQCRNFFAHMFGQGNSSKIPVMPKKPFSTTRKASKSSHPPPTRRTIVTRSRDEISAAHEQWGREMRMRAGPRKTSWDNVKDVERKLRVGYISPDFNKHSVAYFFEAVLRCRSRENFHVTCYYAATKEDAMSRRLREMSDAWVSIASKPPALVRTKNGPGQGTGEEKEGEMRRVDVCEKIDEGLEMGREGIGTVKQRQEEERVAHWCWGGGQEEEPRRKRRELRCLQVAKMIEADQIDLLVELSGHTASNRLDVMALHPAPIQLLPLSHIRQEELIRLPDSFLCYTPAEEAGPVAPAPCEALHYVTFGSFNNVAK